MNFLLLKIRYVFYLLIGLLTFGVVFTGLMLAFPKGSFDIENIPESTQTSTSSASANNATKDKDSAATIPKNWKTYKNTKYNFLVKYPPKWVLENKTTLKRWDGITIKTKKGGSSPHVQIWPNWQEFQDYTSYFGSEFNQFYTDEIIKTTFAGRKAREKQAGYNYWGTTYFRAIRIEDIKGLNWVKYNLIKYSVSSAEKSDELIDNFDLVLSTFKFTK
ncbi:hypothetical protein IID23_00570 [Patescibacteria group bacterium]|nr:hypothetical protein [Patescibacteria group bacterium]